SHLPPFPTRRSSDLDPLGAEPWRQLDHHDYDAAGRNLRSERLAGRPSDAMLAVHRDPVSLLRSELRTLRQPEHDHWGSYWSSGQIGRAYVWTPVTSL